MTQFTVFFAPAGDEEFSEGSTYKIEANGVLTIASAGRIRKYAPTAWHHVDAPQPPPSEARVTILR